MASEARLGAPDSGRGKLVIDFGGPNVAKPMHVGHLRSSIIGDCLQRLFRANGWQVTGDVHLGDWGLQMGKLISEIGRRGIAPVYFDAGYSGPYPEESPVTMDDWRRSIPLPLRRAKPIPRGSTRPGRRPQSFRPAGRATGHCGGIFSAFRSMAKA